MFAPKMENYLRFPLDCKNLSDISKPEVYQVPLMNECFDLSGKASVFLTLDQHISYGKGEIENEDQNKTAFI